MKSEMRMRWWGSVSWPVRVFGALIVLRSLYAVSVWLFAVLVLGGETVASPEMTRLFQSAPLWLLAPWMAYCLAYAATGVLVWQGRRLAALVTYCAGFVVDTAIWILHTSIILPDVGSTRWVAITDTVMNITDLTVIAILAMMLIRRVMPSDD